MAYKEQRQLDVYHRAFKELRRETLPHETSRKHRASLHKNNQQSMCDLLLGLYFLSNLKQPMYLLTQTHLRC